MNISTDPLKQIARDLVDKKLWPVAILLLAAIIAVPTLIGGSSSEEARAPAALVATAPEAPGAQGLVTAAEQAVTGKDSRPGPVRDPIYNPPASPELDAGSGADTAVAGDAPAGGGKAGDAPAGGGKAGDAPAGGGKAGGGTRSGATPAETTPQQPAEPVYQRTQVRWYESSPSKPRPLARLEPLGGLVDTAALYLGVTRSRGSYAVFLLGPNATSDGEAKCEDADCRVIGLKAGQTQRVTVSPSDGSEARRYVLDVTAVEALKADAATVRKMRLRVHPDGRDVMRELWSDRPTAAALRPIQFDRDSGLLVKSAATAGAAAGADQPAE